MGNTLLLQDNGSIQSVPILAGSTLTASRDLHDHRTVLLNATAGSVVTLPASTGNGARFRFQISVLATSNSHKIQVANSSDIIQGVIVQCGAAGATTAFAAGASDDTITLNRTTTGCTKIGEWVELVDVAANTWAVTGVTAISGTAATPFSSAV